MKTRVIHTIIVGLSLLVSVSCMNLGSTTSPGTTLYLLEPVADAAGTALPDNYSLGVGPISIPRYLNRPHIVTRQGANVVAADEFHQWAEPLQDGVAQVMNENLAAMTGAVHVHTFPWKRSIAVDAQVAVKVFRFDADADNMVTLIAQWFIYGDQGKTLIQEQRSTFTREAEGTGYGPMVSAMSEVLGDLASEISGALAEHASK